MNPLESVCRDMVCPLLIDCLHRLDNAENTDIELCRRLVEVRAHVELAIEDANELHGTPAQSEAD